MSVKSIHPPELPDILAMQKKDIFASLNCIQIGIIQSFDATTQTASILLALKHVINIEPKGVKTLKERPVILKCPVITLFGGTSFVSLPITEGDNCIVLFNDRQIDDWFVNGGVQTPTSSRMHDVSDAIAIVGVRSLQDSIASYLANGIRLSFNEGNSKIDLISGAINSLATLFTHTGNLTVTGNVHIEGGLEVDGTATGTGGTFAFGDNVTATGKSITAGTLHAANGATGTYTIVNVVNGIVLSGS